MNKQELQGCAGTKTWLGHFGFAGHLMFIRMYRVHQAAVNTTSSHVLVQYVGRFWSRHMTAHLIMLTGFSPEGFPSKKWLKPRMNSKRGTAWMRVMLPSMLLLFSTSCTAYLSGLKNMPSSAKDTVVKKTPCRHVDRAQL